MSRIWRWITPVAVAGGLVAGVPAIPAAAASTAATSIITINATSPHYPGLPAKDHGLVDGFPIVIYKVSGANTGVVSGTVTTTAVNDTANLLAEPFGAKTYSKVASQALTPTSGKAPYSFSVSPSLATHYKVQVTGTDSATSVVKTVYVTEGGRIAHIKAHPSGHTIKVTYRLYVVMPASALKTEIGKHWYLYLAIGYPRLPKSAPLDNSATVSKATKVNSGEYYRTFGFSVPLRRNVNPLPIACVKDTESKDGMGLPGRHGCGAKRVSTHVLYLG